MNMYMYDNKTFSHMKYYPHIFTEHIDSFKELMAERVSYDAANVIRYYLRSFDDITEPHFFYGPKKPEVFKDIEHYKIFCHNISQTLEKDLNKVLIKFVEERMAPHWKENNDVYFKKSDEIVEFDEFIEEDKKFMPEVQSYFSENFQKNISKVEENYSCEYAFFFSDQILSRIRNNERKKERELLNLIESFGGHCGLEDYPSSYIDFNLFSQPKKLKDCEEFSEFFTNKLKFITQSFVPTLLDVVLVDPQSMIQQWIVGSTGTKHPNGENNLIITKAEDSEKMRNFLKVLITIDDSDNDSLIVENIFQSYRRYVENHFKLSEHYRGEDFYEEYPDDKYEHKKQLKRYLCDPALLFESSIFENFENQIEEIIGENFHNSFIKDFLIDKKRFFDYLNEHYEETDLRIFSFRKRTRDLGKVSLNVSKLVCEKLINSFENSYLEGLEKEHLTIEEITEAFDKEFQNIQKLTKDYIKDMKIEEVDCLAASYS